VDDLVGNLDGVGSFLLATEIVTALFAPSDSASIFSGKRKGPSRKDVIRRFFRPVFDPATSRRYTGRSAAPPPQPGPLPRHS